MHIFQDLTMRKRMLETFYYSVAVYTILTFIDYSIR